MRYCKYLLLLGIFAVLPTNAYLFGFKSADNSIENIQTIEQKYQIHLPLVAFIFDPRGDYVVDTLNALPKTLGETRIYHITISPNNFSAQEVASGAFDQEYTTFFKTIKKNNLKVVFRTMHEMNGGRYPRASNPEAFKKAWIHVWELSRKAGLTTGDIQFDMSVNHWDMPTKGIPSQTARLIPCQLKNKAKLNCFTFEDYYPGDKYVDVMGFTFYNRGKGNSDRKWLTPANILYEKGRNPLPRIQAFHKPIVIDEVGTSAVRYMEDFNRKKSRDIFKVDYRKKNIWLWQLKQVLIANEDIIGIVYFNVDYTVGLSQRLIGEADRAVINPVTNKVYNTIFSLLKDNDQLHKRSALANMFGVGALTLNGITRFLPIDQVTATKNIWHAIQQKYTGTGEKETIISQLSGTYPGLSNFISPETKK